MDYLDVIFNLIDSSYRLFNKTNNEINCIHKQSNHPPSIIKPLPLFVERYLRKLSPNEKMFNESIPIYKEALVNEGYNHKLTYQKHDQKKANSQQRKRQITCFNLPRSKNLTTKLGKLFLSLTDNVKIMQKSNKNMLLLPTQYKINNKTHTTEIYYIRHQLFVEEFAITSIYHNVPYNKSV